ncbi:MAG: hypothetical protein AB1896_13505 [Thermodesulfobacteriota bacterium]
MNQETGQIGDTSGPWRVDLFRPEDGPGVARVFTTVYGQGYPVRTFIEPERLVAENAAGRTISSVARVPGGRVVGHNALFNSAPFEGLFESGAGAVLPEYRGGGVFTALVAHGQQVAAGRPNVAAIFGESVCHHLFSQKLTSSLGWVTMAFEADLMPARAYDREKSAAGRVSAVLDFLTLRPRPHLVYLPVRYEEVLRFLYEGLKDRRELRPSQDIPAARVETSVRAEVFDFAQVARLAVLEAGADFPSVLAREEERAADRGARVFQVWLKLTRPHVGRLAEILNEHGYFLGGLLPRWFDDDGLLMQKLLDPPNFGEVRLHTARAEQLFEYIKSDCPWG